MKNIVIGILAHVDAGKTTLSEGILYKTGELRNLGRVDNKDTFLDNNSMEKARGITIFSKQANFSYGNTSFVLLDTPGHVDFSSEMERTLQVLDYAILVISASSGVQGHTATLWRLFKQYDIPVFIFVNKMDQPDNDRAECMSNLSKELGDNLVDFNDNNLSDAIYENIAVASSDENILNIYLNTGNLDDDMISTMVKNRQIFPCYFGSALKLYGITELLDGINRFSKPSDFSKEFGARIFKITRDAQGNRLTHMKITGGLLNVKDSLINDEKVNQIRLYSGEKYETINTAYPGTICTVTGLNSSYAGQGLGNLKNNNLKLLEPVLNYAMIFPPEINSRQMYPKFKTLEEEFPELCIEWNDGNEEILVKLMGQVHLEILQNIIKDKYGFIVEFGPGTIIYKETITASSIGVGHFEPLRHYAEVHLLLEPAERGTGIEINSDLSEDILDKNWQRLILSHIKEKNHIGVLTGSQITDIKITLINGKAHQKHTEGGDFRQATYRAIRHGLMMAESILLEPYYKFRLEVPAELLGRAMTDIDSMKGIISSHDIIGDKALIMGRAPVSTIRDYQINLNAYTHGRGALSLYFDGYDLCTNSDTIISEKSYNPENDIDNPVSSVFCAHGAGFIVPWEQVYEYMHLTDDRFNTNTNETSETTFIKRENFDYSIGLEEIDEIISRTFESNRKSGKNEYKKKKTIIPAYKSSTSANNYNKEKLLIVDGYNIIFAWDELKSLSDINIDSAKDRLIHILSNYHGITEIKIILVFDGYKVKGNHGSEELLNDIHVIHTKEHETADLFIEQFTNKNRLNYKITVASSDGLIQQITRGQDCNILSARDLLNVINNEHEEFRKNYNIE